LPHGRIYCSGPNGTFALGFRGVRLWHGEGASCSGTACHAAEWHERHAGTVRPVIPLDDPKSQASGAFLLPSLEPPLTARDRSLELSSAHSSTHRRAPENLGPTLQCVLTGLAHTAVCVPDVGEAVRWYSEVLGL